jgi:hypothetical protein
MNSTVKSLLEGMSNRTGYLFPGDRGGKYNGNFTSQRFRKAIKDCGLDKRLHFHSLRHTFASLLVKEGISLYHVQKLLGHSSPRVTEIYAHLGGAELFGSVETLALNVSANAAWGSHGLIFSLFVIRFAVGKNLTEQEYQEDTNRRKIAAVQED